MGKSTVSWSRWAERAGCCGRGDKGEGTGSLLSAASTRGDLHNTTNTQANTHSGNGEERRTYEIVYIRTIIIVHNRNTFFLLSHISDIN